MKARLLGMNLPQLQALAASLGMPKFAARQIAEWLYQKRVTNIDAMTNLSKQNREKLAAHCEIGLTPPCDCQRSVDGTIKYLFQTGDGSYVETVYIPDGDRATLCVSCQVGCKMHCAFCMTGRQGWHGDLTTGDILNQIYGIPESESLTNIVFMGQGEPMDNLDAVLGACEIMQAPYGQAWSPKRITVSTVGLKAGLRRFLDESECHLAVSLHNPIPEQRREMMPAEKAFSIVELVELLRRYDFSHQRRLSFEYIVFGGLNDSMTYARELVKLLQGLECRINLIRFHTIPDTPFRSSDEKVMESLRDYLTSHGLFTTIRASRGQDIFAACGLLSTAKERGEVEG